MAMLIVRYRNGSKASWGRLTGQAPLCRQDMLEMRRLPVEVETTAALITALEKNPQLAEAGTPGRISAVNLLSPITNDAQLVCQGLNYRDHAAEAGHHSRKQNLFFMKASSSLSGPYDDVYRPPEVQLLDYEVEFAIVVRANIHAAASISAANIGDFVAGVVLCDDVSARDTMFGASFFQWFQGKSYRTFCPAGPVLYLLERSEVATALESLEISLSLNGEPRQQAVSSQLIYKPPETLTLLTQFMDLRRGDVVLTGTPGGVIAQGSPKLMEILRTLLLADEERRAALRTELLANAPFLQPGDTLRLRIRDLRTGTELGGQETRIAALPSR
jgi:2-keto-4-pentenoate hydratase/2-oxohepta-3-ene-1,7-dioic acid hydratase in catechol pathway